MRNARLPRESPEGTNVNRRKTCIVIDLLITFWDFGFNSWIFGLMFSFLYYIEVFKSNRLVLSRSILKNHNNPKKLKQSKISLNIQKSLNRPAKRFKHSKKV